ncbi:hypothetical protein DRE_04373 [Drechslerella stenobrocha 248]|uniref:F-box domain-containing protein n=1 Tax=Drechslerella stenobrocha 248 TaxID=1043628 RepID=W7IBE7_9PEZI|nr:hypothetical protein DRE_04373 [Drechslerella stenobrocha 248]
MQSPLNPRELKDLLEDVFEESIAQAYTTAFLTQPGFTDRIDFTPAELMVVDPHAMDDYWQKQQALVRQHYNFEVHYEPPVSRERPPWHGPIRQPKKPTRSVVWWSKDAKDTLSSPVGSSSQEDEEDDENRNGRFLLRVFSQPDPIARSVASYLNVADINSLVYTCREFRRALSGLGVWSWMLTTLNFGDEAKGATDAFNGLRRLMNRRQFWDNFSIQTILSRFNISRILVRANLDNTGINAAGIKWLLNTFPRLVRLSIRYCERIVLQDFQRVLEEYAGKDNFSRVRLKDTFIDYWATPEIYKIVYMTIVDQGSLAEIAHVANCIRHIDRLIRSNVFLCHRNHGETGVYYKDLAQYRTVQESTYSQPSTFYPCELKDVTCSVCKTTFTRRLCSICWASQICSHCNEFRCVNCEPAFYNTQTHTGDIIPATLALLKTSQPCCSEIRGFFHTKHYFHTTCWVEAQRENSCAGCGKYICWQLPSLACQRCLRRQCPSTAGYIQQKCQHCKIDNSYEKECRAIPPPKKSSSVFGVSDC